MCSSPSPLPVLLRDQNRPGPRANVTGMNPLLIYVIGANAFSSIDNRQTGQRWLVIRYFRRARDWIQPVDVSVWFFEQSKCYSNTM